METGKPSTTNGSQTSVQVSHQQLGCSNSIDRSQFDGSGDDVMSTAGNAKVLLAFKNVSQHMSCSGLKAGIHILKVALQWKQECKTRRSGTANRQSVSSSSHPGKKSPLDQLAALILSGQSRLCHLGQQQHQDFLCASKPQNCKRIVVLGAPRVGKTSILRRYLRDGFADEYKPTSEDFLRKLFRIRGETYQIDVLDASGERSFPAKRRLSILTGDIFLLVFSLDDRGSFDEVCILRKEILAAKAKLARSSVARTARQCAHIDVPIVICANKVDIPLSERDISREEVLQILGEDCTYFETSAKDSTSLENVFETLAKQAGLPTETGPSQHRKVSIRSYQAMWTGCVPERDRRRRAGDDPCGALYPLARRPSFSSDLRQVLGPDPTQKSAKPKPLEKCQIQ